MFAPPPIFVSIVNLPRPDATIAIGTERIGHRRIAETDPELNQSPESTPLERSGAPVRIADQSPEVPGEAVQQKRRDIVNSLFQDGPGAKQQTVEPVAGEQSEDAAALNRRLRESFPMLLPMNDEGMLEAVPEGAAADRPVPPPLPEPAQLKESASNVRRAAGHPAPAIMAGVLLTMVRQRTLRRAFRRITGWRNLVV
ncbi:MAG: hypothetical protein O3B86_05220, partial [Planctomycetota bacterium]|nr:hypothetical protein [Planctomycetota bacterium]